LLDASHSALSTPLSTLHPEVALGARNIVSGASERRIAALRAMVTAQCLAAPDDAAGRARAHSAICAAVAQISALRRGLAA
jgi:hypothetical protein